MVEIVKLSSRVNKLVVFRIAVEVVESTKNVGVSIHIIHSTIRPHYTIRTDSNDMMQHPIPDIPGVVIPPYHRDLVQSVVRESIPDFRGRFPGAQPVSMTRQSLRKLEDNSYWVCEKTDGVRVLLLVVWNEAMQKQDAFLVGHSSS